jgi:hypothetical protein
MEHLIKVSAAFVLGINFASPILAATELPVATIKQMADVNSVNGRCAFSDVRILDDASGKYLSFQLKVDDQQFTSFIKTKPNESSWMESQGIGRTGSPFWKFYLKDGDRSSLGAVTKVDWDVQGSENKTMFLWLDYIDPVTGSETHIECM